MKLKALRRHYHTRRADRSTWIPKRSFKSQSEIRAAGFPPSKWGAYRCNYCGDLHLYDKDKL